MRVASQQVGTNMKVGFKQAILSSAIFFAVLAGLVSVDNRVRESVGDLFWGTEQVTPLGDRVGDLGDALIGAVRQQSIENAPLLVFAAGGAVLFVFMVKS